MMVKLPLLACAVCVVVGSQYREQVNDGTNQFNQYQQKPHLPSILMHKQALGEDGSFNYAFAADNGLQQGETISPDGSRIGSYSYVDPNGKTVSVKYSAGKEGFKILEGDHVPKTPSSISPASVATTQSQHGTQYYQPKQYQHNQNGVGVLYHRAHAAIQPHQNVPTLHQAQNAPTQYQNLGFVDHGSPFRESFSGFGSESRFVGVQKDINSLSSALHSAPINSYGNDDEGSDSYQDHYLSLGNTYDVGDRGPVTFPPQPRPVPQYSNVAQQSDQQSHQVPHTFGTGYSFEFSG